MAVCGPTMKVLVIFLSLLHTADGYATGAPSSTCWTRYPKHSHTFAQESPPPFIIELSEPNYSPADRIKVTIFAPDGRTLAGLQIGAYRDEGNPQLIEGQFETDPNNKLRVFTCFGGFKNMATHSNPEAVQNATIYWRAPDKNVGNLTFIATVVEEYYTFWLNVKANLPVADTVGQVAPPEYPYSPLTSLSEDIDFDGCGSSKGCLLYPRQCQGSGCLAAVTYQYRRLTKDFLFELHTTSADKFNYVAIALSADEKMGQDQTFSCVSSDGYLSIQEGFNPGYYNERLLKRYVSETSIRHRDSILQCKFALAVAPQVYRINHEASTFTYESLVFNLNQSWYLHLAWGEAMKGSDVLSYHKEMPVVSDSKINVFSSAIQRGSSFHALVHAHAAVMMIAWVFLAGIVTVVSRHYKDWMGETTWCGTKIWFQIHRELAITIAVLTALGLIFIFAHYGSEIRDTATPHAYVGLTVMAGVGAQLIMGMLRPGGDHELRPIFNWAHWFLGQACHILAATTMFLAFKIEYINRDMRKFGFIVLSIWVAAQVLWHLGFEYLAYWQRRRENPESYSINTKPEDNKDMDKERDRSDNKKSNFYTVVFSLYIITLLGLCIACLLSFLLY